MTRPTLVLLAVLALAGCASPSAQNSNAQLHAENDPLLDALTLEGTYWMPTSLGMSTATGSIPFPLNTSDLSVTIILRVGTRVAGIDVPASSAMVMAKLVDASNKTVAEAMIMPPDKEAKIETTNATAGECRIILETHGGSDGNANGDYVAYVITAAPRQA